MHVHEKLVVAKLECLGDAVRLQLHVHLERGLGDERRLGARVVESHHAELQTQGKCNKMQ